jgi:hypothetical protein
MSRRASCGGHLELLSSAVGAEEGAQRAELPLGQAGDGALLAWRLGPHHHVLRPLIEHRLGSAGVLPREIKGVAAEIAQNASQRVDQQIHLG